MSGFIHTSSRSNFKRASTAQTLNSIQRQGIAIFGIDSFDNVAFCLGSIYAAV